MACGGHCPQLLVGAVMAANVCILVCFFSTTARSLGMKCVMVNICCCIPTSSMVDKLFHQPKIIAFSRL